MAAWKLTLAETSRGFLWLLACEDLESVFDWILAGHVTPHVCVFQGRRKCVAGSQPVKLERESPSRPERRSGGAADLEEQREVRRRSCRRMDDSEKGSDEEDEEDEEDDDEEETERRAGGER